MRFMQTHSIPRHLRPSSSLHLVVASRISPQNDAVAGTLGAPVGLLRKAAAKVANPRGGVHEGL
jgi:hypothetical protein